MTPRGTVIILREPARAEVLQRLLVERGYEVISRPVTRIAYLEHPSKGDFSARIRASNVVVFTSLNGVEAFERMAGGEDRLQVLLRDKRVAVLGAEALGKLRSLGVAPRVVEPHGGAARLGDRLVATLSPDSKVLYPTTATPLPALSDALRRAGHQLDHLPCYETLAIPLAERAFLDWNRVLTAIVAAPSAVAAVSQEPELPSDFPFVAIGPTTAAALRRHGLRAAAVAESPAAVKVCEAVERVAASGP